MKKHPFFVFALAAVAAAGLFTLNWAPVEEEFDQLRLKSFDRVLMDLPPEATSAELTEDYIINPDDCISCRICLAACPFDAIYMTEDNKARIDPDLCVQCGACVASCPVGAIVTVGTENIGLYGVRGEEEIPVPGDLEVE